MGHLTRNIPANPVRVTGSLADYDHTADLYGEHGQLEDTPAGFDIQRNYGAWGADPDDGFTAYTARLIWLQAFKARLDRPSAVLLFGEESVEAAEARAADDYSETMQ